MNSIISSHLTDEMARTYMGHLNAVIQGEELSPEDYQQWVELTDLVDYARYCKDIETPEFARGRVVSISGKNWIIEWSDGTRDAIPRGIAEEQMGWLVADERLLRGSPVPFTARVKWDADGSVEILRDIQPVSRAEAEAEEAVIDELVDLLSSSDDS